MSHDYFVNEDTISMDGLIQKSFVGGGFAIVGGTQHINYESADYIVGECVKNYYGGRILELKNVKVGGGSKKSRGGSSLLFPYLHNGSKKSTTTHEILTYIIDKSEMSDVMIKKLNDLIEKLSIAEQKKVETIRNSVINGKSKYVHIPIFDISCGNIEASKYDPTELCALLNCIIDYLMEADNTKTFEKFKCEIDYPANSNIILSDDISDEEIFEKIEEPLIKVAKNIEDFHIIVMKRVDDIINTFF